MSSRVLAEIATTLDTQIEYANRMYDWAKQGSQTEAFWMGAACKLRDVRRELLGSGSTAREQSPTVSALLETVS